MNKYKELLRAFYHRQIGKGKRKIERFWWQISPRRRDCKRGWCHALKELGNTV